jgi:hypothetical protein
LCLICCQESQYLIHGCHLVIQADFRKISKFVNESITETFGLIAIEKHIAGNFSDEESYLLGYNAVKSVESQPMFQRNISLPSSGVESTSSKKPA